MSDIERGNRPDLLCPDCAHHLHRPNPGPCQWYDCPCGRSSDPEPAPAAQYFDSLATMVGEFARDFVEPEARMDAIDRLYSLLNEARRAAVPALQATGEPREPGTYDEAVQRVHRAFCDPKHELVGEWDREMAEALQRNGYQIIEVGRQGG